MNSKTKDEIIIRRYLLGELSQEEQAQVEQKLMIDGDYFHLTVAMEEEFIDQYLSDGLLSDEREKFSRRFLSTPEGAEQLKLAANLRRYSRNNRTGLTLLSSAVDTRPAKSGWFSRFSRVRFASAAAVILLTTILIVMAYRIWQLQDQIETLRARQELPTLREQELQNQIAEQQARNDELASSLQQEQEKRAKLEQEVIALSGSRADRPQPLIATLVLTPGRIRGTGQDKRLNIKPGLSRVQLILLVREPVYSAYQAALQNASGEEIWISGSLTPQVNRGRITIRATLSAQLLSSVDYMLRLRGRTDNGDYEDAGNYYFRVSKE